MKLTCLSKGDGFHYPPCHMLNLCGFRILIDCPLDLSAIKIFSPVISCVASEASKYPSDESLDAQNPIQKKHKLERQLTFADLVCEEPWYKTVKPLHLWDASFIDIVLISNPMGLLGLPFLTQNPGFSAKIYMTEATAKIGQLMMEDLVSMHAEFRCFHGPDNSSFPGWIKNLDREQVPALLKKVVFGESGDDLGSWMRLYSLDDIESCMKKVQAVKFAEEVCYNGTLIIKALSSGLDIGACNWLINGPNGSLSYVSDSIFVSHHARNFDFHGLKGTDVLIYSDFSSLQSAEVTENGCISPDPDNNYISTTSDNKDSLLNTEDSLEEMEKLEFICSCAAESADAGGSTLITITRIGIVLQLLELMSNSLESSSLKVPIFVISSVAEELLAYTNTIPEWLCEQQQEKLISGEPSFGHLKFIKDKKIHLFPAIHSPNLITSWQEPCIIFAPHWSLRLGPSVQLLQRWRGDPKSLLVLEDGISSGLGLLPFRPIAMKILQCSFLSGIRLQKLPTLLSVLQPKIVLVPDAVNQRINFAAMKTISILNYFENKTLRVPRIADNPSVEITTDLASKLSWRKLRQRENFGIARLKGGLLMEDGKHRLVSGLEQEESSGKARPLRHWGSVAPESLLDALLKIGIKGSLEQSIGETGSDDNSIIHIANPSSGLIEVSEMGTAIITDDENVASQVFQAIDGILDGI
ncbi:integrator complex subunit 9 isoform X2 [Arabidopsis lyrata subsp. lyrata]|uniref:integrator complex subunit 9 isoform X2 n=1 Tax=Arabidopsis lyrata subsp. lyrata TaxID=81972 RepID=UPI000A29E56A|nr:integrator complex subunit 9 isoform X2 [Arabidopsis lyrata subsp. lyrata]|eukprot:XP_020887277.1 integrator complex subunit 9 isoform X2 [Arabidopsis lyrata subsp. lyrata]